MNKGLYLAAVYGGLLGGGALAAFGATLLGEREDVGVVALVVGCALIVIVPAVAMAVLAYRMWSALPVRERSTSPGAAVGLLFVPLFNLYWVFRVYPGFARDFNRCAAARSDELYPISQSLFTAFAVLTLLGVVPFVGFLASLLNLFLVGFVIGTACDAVNQLRSVPADSTFDAVEREPSPAPRSAVASGEPHVSTGDATDRGVAVQLGEPHFTDSLKWRLAATWLWNVALLLGGGALAAWSLTRDGMGPESLVENLVRQWLPFAIAVPAVVLILARGGIDLSIGAVAACAGVVFAWLVGEGEVPPLVGLFLTLGFCGVVGLLNAALVGGGRIHGALATLAVALVVRGFAFGSSGERHLYLEDLLDPDVFGPLGWVALAVLAVPAMFLAHTHFARSTMSRGCRESWGAHLVWTAPAYVVSSIAAGVTGLCFAFHLGVASPVSGVDLDLTVLLAAVIGGTRLGGRCGSVVGGLLGAAFVVLLRHNLIVASVDRSAVLIVEGVVLIVALVLSHAFAAVLNGMYAARHPRIRNGS